MQIQKLCVFLFNRDKDTTLDASVKYRLRWREMFVDSALMICKGGKKIESWDQDRLARKKDV